MLAGHFGLAAAVKSREPQVPLWSLLLACQLPDILFYLLNLLGVEHYSSVSGTGTGYGNLTFIADYSQSLAGALVLSVLATLIAMIFWRTRNGVIAGATVFSNWLLNVIVHRPDISILPGNTLNIHLGLSLWTVPWAAALLELVLVLVGAFLYYQAAMRAAIRVERQEARESGRWTPAQVAAGISGPTNSFYRQQALLSSAALSALMLISLALNYFLGGVWS